MPNLIAGKKRRQAVSKSSKTSTANRAKRKSKDWRFTAELLKRNKVVEVMVTGVSGRSQLWTGNPKDRVVGKYNNIKDIKRLLHRLKAGKIKYTNVYMTFNCPKKGSYEVDDLNQLFSTENPRAKVFKDEHISFCQFLFVDVDPVSEERPSAKEVSDLCIATCKKIRKDLMGHGFSDPIVVETGNGSQMFFPLRGVKNNRDNVSLIKGILTYLDKKISTSDVKIDVKVGNPSRYSRLPGTVNRKRKGNSTEKCRYSQIIYYPPKLQPISLTRFQQVANELVLDNEKLSSSPEKENVSGPILNVEKYLTHYGHKIVKVKMVGGAKFFCVKECVFDSSHSGNDAAIVQQPDGTLSYQCFHDSCDGKTWKEARRIISGENSLAEFMTGETWVGNSRERSYENLTIIDAADVSRYVSTVKPIVQNFLGEDEATIVAGKGGDGKSFLTLFLAMAGASLKVGSHIFGEFKLEKQFSTLMIQAENSIHDVKSRIDLLVKKNPGFENSKSDVKFIGFNGGCRVSGAFTDPDFQKAVIALIISAQIKVIIIDPLISFANENENENSGMRRDLDALRYIMDCTKVSAIVVHHSAKSWDGRGSCLRGASAIRDWADNVVSLRKIEKSGEDYLLLSSEKSRNSVNFKPFSVKFTGLQFERAVVIGENKSEIVVTALKQLGGKASTQTELGNQIIELIGGSLSTANRYIKEALDAGLVQEVKDGRSKGVRLVDDDDVDE